MGLQHTDKDLLSSKIEMYALHRNWWCRPCRDIDSHRTYVAYRLRWQHFRD